MTALPPAFRPCALLATALALLVGSRTAGAAAVGVSLVDTAGKPLGEAVVLLEAVAPKAAVKPMAEAEISQSKKQFHPRVTVVTVGTKVNFPNFDTVRHHVYSFSATKTFELKLYAGTPGAPVVFDKPGVGVIGCNIHDNMAAWIVVAETAWFGVSAANGHVRVDNVPAGAYRLRLWHPGLAPGTEPAPTMLTVGAADIEQTASLAVTALP